MGWKSSVVTVYPSLPKGEISNKFRVCWGSIYICVLEVIEIQSIAERQKVFKKLIN